MAVADAKRIIRRLQHGDDIFSIADDFGVTPDQVAATLRDPEGSAALPAPATGGGGGNPNVGSSGSVVDSFTLDGRTINAATDTPNSPQAIGTVAVKAGHTYEVVCAVRGTAAPDDSQSVPVLTLRGVPGSIEINNGMNDQPGDSAFTSASVQTGVPWLLRNSGATYVTEDSTLEIGIYGQDYTSEDPTAPAINDLQIDAGVVFVRDISLYDLYVPQMNVYMGVQAWSESEQGWLGNGGDAMHFNVPAGNGYQTEDRTFLAFATINDPSDATLAFTAQSVDYIAQFSWRVWVYNLGTKNGAHVQPFTQGGGPGDTGVLTVTDPLTIFDVMGDPEAAWDEFTPTAETPPGHLQTAAGPLLIGGFVAASYSSSNP